MNPSDSFFKTGTYGQATRTAWRDSYHTWLDPDQTSLKSLSARILTQYEEVAGSVRLTYEYEGPGPALVTDAELYQNAIHPS